MMEGLLKKKRDNVRKDWEAAADDDAVSDVQGRITTQHKGGRKRGEGQW